MSESEKPGDEHVPEPRVVLVVSDEVRIAAAEYGLTHAETLWVAGSGLCIDEAIQRILAQRGKT